MHQKSVEDTCNEANKRFISESLSGYPKYKYLPQWLTNFSQYLTNDRIKPKKNYKVYKRGTIVYIDFGINVGHELSGNHFAIILNNYDNAKNGLLTVLPISSKEKKNYVPVGVILGTQSIRHVINYSDKQQEKLRILILAALSTGLLNPNKLSPILIDIADKGAPLNKEDVLKKAQKLNLVSYTPQELKQKTNELLKEIHQSRKVFDTYKKYTKESYIMPLNIQSISKNRIRRLNKFDPVGQIKAPANVLDKIDQALMDKFIKH
ncbi:type II toxin-antitoxin system PemK/MazF family toxin [Enterococcus alishanensis]